MDLTKIDITSPIDLVVSTINPELMSVPVFVIGMPITNEFENTSLFEKINDTTIRLNNPHFVQIN